jgi:hypothetical protein
MVTVRVLYGDTGKAAERAKVSLGFSGLLRGVTRDEFTDRNGDAHFDAEPGTGKVFVKGKKVHEGYLSGRVIVYI